MKTVYRKTFYKRLGISVLASLLVASPVFAETNPSLSESIRTNRNGTFIPFGETRSTIKVAPGLTDNRSGFDLMAVLQNNQDALSGGVHKALAPYLGQKVAKVSISGFTHVEARDVLLAVKLKPGTPLTEAAVGKDLQSLYEMGWFNAVKPLVTKTPQGVAVNYQVSENPVYQGTSLIGNTKLTGAQVLRTFDLPQGQVVNNRQVNTRVQRLLNSYVEQGYAMAKVTDVKIQPDGILAVYINEGIIDSFKVQGNDRTRDKVILRELRFKPGDVYNTQLARRSLQRLYNLGYFQEVNLNLNPGRNPDNLELVVDVEEGNTMTIGLGAGYSASNGAVGTVTVSDTNLGGTGDRASALWEFGGREHNNANYELSYTKPWLDDQETAATLTVYNMTDVYADYNHDDDEVARYNKKRLGQELTLSRRTNNEYVSNYLTLKNRYDSYEGKVDGYSTQYYEDSYDGQYYNEFGKVTTAAQRQDENFGNTRSITLARVFDSRDNIYDARYGKRTSYSLEQAGLGGDFNFTKAVIDYRYYFRQPANRVIAVELGAGYAWGDLPLSQRFTMGGSNTLRGYSDDQYRGNSMLRATAEYRVPMAKKIQGVLFVDSGYAWDKRYDERNFDLGLIKIGYGLGFRVRTPLGPIRLDYGWGKEDSRFHFSFGGQF